MSQSLRKWMGEMCVHRVQENLDNNEGMFVTKAEHQRYFGDQF
jgi:hypothetical protein